MSLPYPRPFTESDLCMGGGLGGRSLVYPFHGQPANNPHCVASSPPLSRVPFDHSSGKLGLQACTQLPTALAEALGRAWPNGTLMNSRPVELARRRSWAQAMKGGEKKSRKLAPCRGDLRRAYCVRQAGTWRTMFSRNKEHAES